MRTSTAPLIHACNKAFTKGCDWYFKQQTPDGSLGTPATDEATFYNALYLFALAARWPGLNRFVAWARQNILDSDGTLRVDHEGIFASRAVYFKAWYMWGAHHFGLFRMSLGAIDVLRRYQNRQCGGFYVSEHGHNSGTVLVELNTTGMAGLACLALGVTREAVAAGDFVVRLLNKQPDLSKGLFGYFDPGVGSLVTSGLGAAEEVRASDDIYDGTETGQRTDLDKYLFYYDNGSEEIQAYANLGAPLTFLCHLYEATDDRRYLDAAMELFGCLDSAGDNCWIRGQTTKVLWGLVSLYAITGQEHVCKAMMKLTDHLCKTQLPDGRWLATIAFDDIAEQPKWVSLCLAGDVLLSLAAVLRNMG